MADVDPGTLFEVAEARRRAPAGSRYRGFFRDVVKAKAEPRLGALPDGNPAAELRWAMDLLGDSGEWAATESQTVTLRWPSDVTWTRIARARRWPETTDGLDLWIDELPRGDPDPARRSSRRPAAAEEPGGRPALAGVARRVA